MTATSPDPKTGPPPKRDDPGYPASLIIEGMPMPFVAVQENRYLVQAVNAAFCQFIGRSRGELVGRPLTELVPVDDECRSILDRTCQAGTPFSHPDNGEDVPRPAHWLRALWPALTKGAPPVAIIIQLTNPHDTHAITAINEALLIAGLRQHELAADALKLNGQLETEIADRKRAGNVLQTANGRLAGQTSELETLIAERTEKLRETVADLEGFSYSVAHDLRTPLRGMQGFSRILLDDYGAKLDDVGRSYLERIASSAARMDMLIQDVLNYTRVMRSEALLTPVDLDRLVRGMIATYPGWQPPKVAIEVDGILPDVLGHGGFLTQCVSNILGNAVKFVATGTDPRIRIWAEDRMAFATEVPWSADGRGQAGIHPVDGPVPVVRIWFEDNGIGITAENRSRVFRMFERINPAEQFEGTGMGLTIVRKAVQRLGGRIDFESVPGRGSKFWIELKKAPHQTSTINDRQ